jgi:Type I phosphodiesterase / nucleotide pyrophosphatase
VTRPRVTRPPKLVLTVVDGMKPTMLERAIGAGSAPALKAIRDRGTYVDDCCAAFPSVTPVCAGTIATGRMQDEHRIPSMNWYSRTDERYVEYGSSFQASRRFGLTAQLVDTIFNMNSQHLSPDTPTIFETLDDAGVRTACTSYLIFRGRHQHEVSRDFALTRVASQLFQKRAVMGPRELFYADIFASRKTGCWSRMGIPGMRDQHAGCVGSHLVEHDLFDFLLLSLPDNDAHSHKFGPHAQIASIAAADAELWRVMEAGGGVDAFLDEHAMIVMADHSHSHIERVIDFTGPFDDWKVLQPSGANLRSAELALCPAQRSAMIYLLLESGASRAGALTKVVATARALEGVDLVMWWGEGDEGIRRAHVAGERGELTFRPAGERGELTFRPARESSGGFSSNVADERGFRWDVDGALDALVASVEDGVFVSEHYPDALRRVWSALCCETSGDVLLSAEPAYEFPDWGRRAHVRGGSHGSLHRVDSLGALLFCGIEQPVGGEHRPWSLADVAPMVLAHFGAG